MNVERLAVAFAAVVALAAQAPAGEKTEKPSPTQFRAYEVNKTVSDFPAKEDFSTPEAAYAAVNRVMTSGDDSAWKRISTKENVRRMPATTGGKKQVAPEVAKMWLDARIIEVRVFREKTAAVLAEITKSSGQVRVDMRSLGLEDGRWLNAGEGLFDSLEEARSAFAAGCAGRMPRPPRPKPDNPDAYLKTFVDFLKTSGENPKTFVMKALKAHRVVIMGEIHHRPDYWALNTSLVKDPTFADAVGTIYMELPSNDQELIDKFLAAPSRDPAPAVEMLRDMMEIGWPDQPMLDFFMAAWNANQRLAGAKRIRIVLVDMQRPWEEILKSGQWRQYDVNRDRYMAQNIIKDLKDHPAEKRSALFIVGVGHAMLGLKFFEGSPEISAGWYLRRELGAEAVYAVFPHEPVETNVGRVDGRLCLGLFDSAFKGAGERPIAFPLDTGPFGKEPFDAMPDTPVTGTFADGYSAYLYLGPLEKEAFSPLIAGFYTEEFVREVDKRYKVLSGKGWAEAYGRPLNSASFIQWMGQSWGKPRREWQDLGPLDAWRAGGTQASARASRPLPMRKPAPGDATISGSVLASKTVTEVGGLRIRLDVTKAWQFVGETDSDGRFKVSVPRGRHRLIVYMRDNEKFDVGVGRANVDVNGDIKDFTIQLDPLGRIRMKITDESGSPIEGAYAGAWWNAERSGAGMTGTISDAQGNSTVYVYPGENMYVGAFDMEGRYVFQPPANDKTITLKEGETIKTTTVLTLR